MLMWLARFAERAFCILRRLPDKLSVPTSGPHARRARGSHPGMPKRSKRPRDLNAMAASIVGAVTDEQPPQPESQQAVAERQGGLKGGWPVLPS